MLTYINPILDHDFPDPTVIRARDGRFYAYATQTLHTRPAINIQVAWSDDLVHWSDPSDALPTKPTWARTTQEFWSPCVDQRGATFIMYFAAKSDGGQGQCLGVATASHPLGPFNDSGAALVTGNGFVNIDPMAFDDLQWGKHYLYWGSGFEPIKVQELTPDRLHLRAESAPVALVAPCDNRRYERLVEGGFIHYHEPFYYLFYSGDDCFSAAGSYAVMVARSLSATGPFETLAQATCGAHSAILEGNDRWGLPGHNSVITDAAGQDWIVYHAVDLARDGQRLAEAPQSVPRVMCMDQLFCHDGWPYVNGGSPSQIPQAAPAVA